MLKPISEAQLKQYNFLNVTEPEQAVSDKYVFISSKKIVKYMKKLDWVPVKVTSRAKKKGKTTEHVQHYIRFRQKDQRPVIINGDELYPEVIFRNSHDRSCSASFKIGYYRQVCSNGLVVAEDEIGVSKKHIGISLKEFQKYMNNLIKTFKRENKVIREYQTIEMTQKDKVWMAKEALKVRYPEGAPDIKIKDLLVPKQPEDDIDTLWNVFNVLQQNVLGGGYQYKLDNGKKRTMKKITSAKIDVVLNIKLWALLNKMYQRVQNRG